ncbi:hypothetical protein O4H49_03420 [Kiloniella laminariae]|uniref:Ribosome maturation factor RimM n=1 Tax=Kiloniella laminariae TaxID=454162 RepID=A0ABT4LFC7_9PROT|nr:hypothetical protein [Kiloniella laminariae]MCZ4279812.1 hypothetical protein [Kiloniella laminariae]
MGMKETLLEVKAKGRLVSLHSKPENWNKCCVGYVDCVSDEHVRLRAISVYGEAAGYEVRRLSEIFKIEFDGQYTKKIEKLNQNQGSVFKEVKLYEKSSGDLVRETLESARHESVLVVVWGNDPDDSLVGYVDKIETDLLTIRLVDEFGVDDGVSVIRFEEITDVDFNTRSEQARIFLHKNR